MKLLDLHEKGKALSAKKLFSAESGDVMAIRILANEQLKKHTTKTPALLICVTGEAVFENEKGKKEILFPGDYTHIEPLVVHWVDAVQESNLLLIK